MIRIGFGGQLYYGYIKEPLRPLLHLLGGGKGQGSGCKVVKDCPVRPHEFGQELPREPNTPLIKGYLGFLKGLLKGISKGSIRKLRNMA